MGYFFSTPLESVAIAASLSEGMALVEHPREAMLIRVRFRLTHDTPARVFDPRHCQAVTQQMIESLAPLRRVFKLTETGLRATELSPDSAADLAARVWEFQNDDLDLFMQRSFGADSKPLFRLRTSPADGVSLIVHHALLDGRAAVALLMTLVSAFVEPTKNNTLPERAHGVTHLSLASLLRIGVELARESFLGLVFSPALLGARQNYFGRKHFYTTTPLRSSEIQEAVIRLRAHVPGLTAHGLMTAALHLALHEQLKQQKQRGEVFGGRYRVSTTTPVDLRGRLRRAPILAHLSSAIRIQSFAWETSDSLRFLKKIQKRLARAHVAKSEYAALLAFSFLGKSGFLKKARATQVRMRLPLRATTNSPWFWRFVDTALLSYMGRVRIPAAIRSYVAEIIGFSPVLPPMGVSVSVGIGDPLDQNVLCEGNLCIHSSDATLSQEQTLGLQESIAVWMRKLVAHPGRESPLARYRMGAAPIDPTQIARELKYASQTLGVFLVTGLFTIVATRLGWGQVYRLVSEHSWTYLLGSFAALVVLHDAYFYLIHRILHFPPLFRRVHRVHHLSRYPNPLTALAFHPFEALLQAAFMPLMVFVMPLHPLVIYPYLFFNFALNAHGHGSHEFYPQGFARGLWTGIWTTATHHSLHHSDTNSNFGLYFTYWDRLFGTEHSQYIEHFDNNAKRRTL